MKALLVIALVFAALPSIAGDKHGDIPHKVYHKMMHQMMHQWVDVSKEHFVKLNYIQVRKQTNKDNPLMVYLGEYAYTTDNRKGQPDCMGEGLEFDARGIVVGRYGWACTTKPIEP